MSGGSLGYVYSKEPEELLEQSNLEYLQHTEERLLKLGYIDIARDVRRLIEYSISARNRIDVLHDQLRDVFRAVEWELSGDYGRDDLIRVLEKYRTAEEQEA